MYLFMLEVTRNWLVLLKETVRPPSVSNILSLCFGRENRTRHVVSCETRSEVTLISEFTIVSPLWLEALNPLHLLDKNAKQREEGNLHAAL